MLRYWSSLVKLIICLCLLGMSFSLASAADNLRFDQARPEDIQGTFSVILLDNPYGNGIQRIALLDREDDAITIEPYALVDEYKIIKKMSGADALKRAREFLMIPIDIREIRLTRISTAQGVLIGYELRPLYYALSYGTDDVLEVSYRLKGEFVNVHMSLADKVEKIFRGDDR